ncbi:MAG: Rieske 2Fe-2S domain-containing protein [Bacteroidales bacterium]
MSVGYVPVQWTRAKKRYDKFLFWLIVVFVVVFVVLTSVFNPNVSPETLLIRTTAVLALLLLHIILSIGPLSRIDKRYLPLLYNRRHLGVIMFIVALIHGVFSMIWFHAYGDVSILRSLFMSNMEYGSFPNFPFQVLGFFTLIILFLMAASSHDFWLAHLSPKMWKALHMFVYIAYLLVFMHVMLGAFQVETSPILLILLGLGMLTLICLHLIAAYKERRRDAEKLEMAEEEWLKVCDASDIEDTRAHVCNVEGERVAIFKYDGKLSAISNVCKHQNGPLGEGKVVDGCVTCPWHGFQYVAEKGMAPPPFTEKISTYNLKLQGNTIFISPKANPEGTYVEPTKLD